MVSLICRILNDTMNLIFKTEIPLADLENKLMVLRESVPRQVDRESRGPDEPELKSQEHRDSVSKAEGTGTN